MKLEMCETVKKWFIEIRRKFHMRPFKAWQGRKLSHSDLIVLAICCTLALVTLFLFVPSLAKTGEEETISITSIDRSPNSRGHEAEITPIVNEKLLEPVRQSEHWEKRTDYYLCQSYNQTITFTFNSLDDNQLILHQNPYAVRILIERSSGKAEIVDLCAETAGTIDYPLSSTVHLRSPLSLILTALLAVGFYLALCILFWLFQRQFKLCAVLALFHFFVISFLNWRDFSYQYVVLLLLDLFCCWHAPDVGMPYRTNKRLCVLTVLLALYTAFAFWGYELFLQDILWNTDIKSVVAYVFLSAMTYSFVLCCLESLERASRCIHRPRGENTIKQEREKSKTKKMRISFRLGVWLFMSCLMVTSCLLLKPANMTWDLIDQWIQARGYIPIDDAHPALHTLFIRLCSMVYPNPVSVTIVQALLLSYVLASILNILEKGGVPRRLLWIIGGLISISPTTIAMITLISKNILFAIVMLWLIYLFMEMFDDPQIFFHRCVLLVQFILAFSVLYIVRHDAFVILPFVAAILLYMTIKHYPKVRVRPIAVLFVSLLLITFIKGPLYDAAAVQSRRTEKSVFSPPHTLITPYTTAIKTEMDLPENICDYLSGILPIEEWKNRYAPYNMDAFSWGSPKPDLSHTNLREVFSNYFWLLRKRPDIVVKDRLDGANLDWDVFSHPGVRHEPYTLGIWSTNGPYKPYVDMESSVFLPERENENSSYSVGNEPLTQFLYKYITLFNDTSFFKALFWRNGLYLILFFLLSLFSIRHKLYRFLAMGSIPFIHLFALFCLFGCPMYQYFWFFPLNITILSLYSISFPGRTAGHKTVRKVREKMNLLAQQ